MQLFNAYSTTEVKLTGQLSVIGQLHAAVGDAILAICNCSRLAKIRVSSISVLYEFP